MTTRQDVVNFAANENGYKEGRNNASKYGAWFGLDHNPWCAMFVSYCFNFAGLPLPAIQTRKGFASVALGERWFRKMGLWKAGNKAQPGDVVIYKFSHTGIVAKNNGRTLSVWEGNTDGKGSRTGGRVMLQERALTLVKGVGTPGGFVAAAVTPGVPDFSKWPGRYLTLTTPFTTGDDVKLLQMRFQGLGGNLEADGVLGPVTYDLIRWWQGALHLQVDGVCGPALWTALFR